MKRFQISVQHDLNITIVGTQWKLSFPVEHKIADKLPSNVARGIVEQLFSHR